LHNQKKKRQNLDGTKKKNIFKHTSVSVEFNFINQESTYKSPQLAQLVALKNVFFVHRKGKSGNSINNVDIVQEIQNN
jgi:hypothetical protein